jgi:hypothetical protein
MGSAPSSTSSTATQPQISIPVTDSLSSANILRDTVLLAVSTVPAVGSLI